MTSLETIADYAPAGLALFPCLPTKQPATANGFHDASTDPAQIDEWFNDGDEHWIGCAIPDGIAIIDMDPRNGGAETVRALVREHGGFPATRTAKTGGGGTHRWYVVPDGARLRTTLGEGVDVKRAGRGYVIVPPSPGYTWTDTRDPVAMPEWMLAALLRPEHEEREAVEPRVALFPWQQGTAYGERALALELEELLEAQPGTRNNALNASAFKLATLVAGGELREEPVLEALANAAEALGLDAEETRITLRSAWDAGLQEPRVAPERPGQSSTLGTAPGTLTELRAAQNAAPVGSEERTFWTRWDVDEPAPPFYLFPLIPKSAYVLVYGATEAAKSMAWNAILADGSRNGVKSSVYSLENPRHVDRDRLRRLHPDQCCFRITHEPLDLADFAQVQALIDREREWQTNVVMIDTYSHAFSSRSEDGNAKAIEFAVIVRHIMHELPGLTVIVIDHTGYAHREEPRDASAKRQQVDVAILMEKRSAWTAGSDRVEIGMENFKAARFANPFETRFVIRGRRDQDLTLEWADEDMLGRWEP